MSAPGQSNFLIVEMRVHLSELLEQLWRGALGGAVHEVEVCVIVLVSRYG